MITVDADSIRCVADVVEQIEDQGHTITQVHIEPFEGDHITVNIDTTTDYIGSEQGMQQALKQISEETVESAAEVAVAILESPDLGAGKGVFWHLEAMVKPE